MHSNNTKIVKSILSICVLTYLLLNLLFGDVLVFICEKYGKY